MSKEFQCKWECGTLLHYDNGKIVDGSNGNHDCPNAPWKHKKADTFEQIARQLTRIADALEYLVKK